MSWFRRAAVDTTDPQPLMDVRAIESEPVRELAVEYTRPTLSPEQASDRLAGYSTEWTRPLPRVEAVAAAWTNTPPAAPGLWWWVAQDADAMEPHLAVVIEFGGRLCVRSRLGDACAYRSVSTLPRVWWSVPVGVPDGVRLEDLGQVAA